MRWTNMWIRNRKYSGRTGAAFFYDRAARIRIKERETAALNKKTDDDRNKIKNSIAEDEPEEEEPKVTNNLFSVAKNTVKQKVQREVMDRQADRIMQNILNASKLLEGRITFEQLLTLDIPTFENIVNNEFENIDRSYAAFKQNGTINAYTKNETTKLDDRFLKEMNRKYGKQ